MCSKDGRRNMPRSATNIASNPSVVAAANFPVKIGNASKFIVLVCLSSMLHQLPTVKRGDKSSMSWIQCNQAESRVAKYIEKNRICQ